MPLFLLLLLALPSAVLAQEKVAFFGMILLDGSLQTSQLGQDPADLQRLEMVTGMVADRFRDEGYQLVDLEPARTEIERHANLAKCYGCDARIAESLGADYALVGEVQKTSNMILAMNLQLRAAGSGDLVRGGVVDIRGNTDETWTRGMRYILKNRIFIEEE